MSFNIYRELKKYKLLCLRVQEQRQRLVEAGCDDQRDGCGKSWQTEVESALLVAMESVESKQYGFICNSVDDIEALTTDHRDEEGEDMSIEETARMREQDAAAIGHQFSDCADVFMQAKQRVEKERDELKYRVGTAEQMTREACCLLRECIPHLTGGPPEYLNNRISVWLASADGAPPPTDHRDEEVMK